ncbi:hypothetical protein J6590_042992 [Homalodisca vitripennis]|nr:hypothetical protein J6590_042992 [Homalodisca vitripennis]
MGPGRFKAPQEVGGSEQLTGERAETEMTGMVQHWCQAGRKSLSSYSECPPQLRAVHRQCASQQDSNVHAKATKNTRLYHTILHVRFRYSANFATYKSHNRGIHSNTTCISGFVYRPYQAYIRPSSLLNNCPGPRPNFNC